MRQPDCTTGFPRSDHSRDLAANNRESPRLSALFAAHGTRKMDGRLEHKKAFALVGAQYRVQIGEDRAYIRDDQVGAVETINLQSQVNKRFGKSGDKKSAFDVCKRSLIIFGPRKK